MHIVLTHAIMTCVLNGHADDVHWWQYMDTLDKQLPNMDLENGAVHAAVWEWTLFQPDSVQPAASSYLHGFYFWVLLFCLAEVLRPPCFSHVFFHCYPAMKAVSCERQDIHKIFLCSVCKSTLRTLICCCNHTSFINCGSQR